MHPNNIIGNRKVRITRNNGDIKGLAIKLSIEYNKKVPNKDRIDSLLREIATLKSEISTLN